MQEKNSKKKKRSNLNKLVRYFIGNYSYTISMSSIRWLFENINIVYTLIKSKKKNKFNKYIKPNQELR